MKHIFICHNLVTLYKSNAFSKANNIEEVSFYIYLDYNAKIDVELSSSLFTQDRYIYAHYPYNRTAKLPYWYWKRYVKSIEKVIKKITDSEQLYLHIYLDMWAFMPTIIDNVKKMYGDSVHLYMHEEGYAMYAPPKEYTAAHYKIKRIIYTFLRLSTYGLTTYAHGNHPAIERIYCSDPERALKAGKKAGVKVNYEGDLFTRENTEAFLRLCGVNVLELRGLFDTYNFIFLSQPVYDIVGYDKYETFIKNLFNYLSDYKILIKLHPRDTFNYEQFLNEDIQLLNGIPNLLPFECLYPCVSNSRILTFNSSCCGNIEPTKKSIYMYRLFCDDEYNKICERVQYDYTKVVIANSYDEIRY